MFGYHAPLWYLLYWPLEWTMQAFLQRIKIWIKKITKPKNQQNDHIGEENVFGKVVVITGANSGIGKQTTIEMAKRGAVVVMGCRDLKRGGQARDEILQCSNLKTVELYRLDLSDLHSVRDFVRKVLARHPVIDILVNNAGICVNQSVQQRSKEGWDLCMLTNHLGHFLLTNLLIKGILASEIRRIVAVSSTTLILGSLDPGDLMMESCQDLGIGNTKPYQNSKLALSLFTKALGKRFPNIRAYSVCPGCADTSIFEKFEVRRRFKIVLETVRNLFVESVDVGVETVLLCALRRKVQGKSGAFFRFGKRMKWIENILTDELAEKVWNASENFCTRSSIQLTLNERN